MIKHVGEIGRALDTTSVRKMAEILGLPIPPKQSLSHLVDVFIEKATPRKPTNLDIGNLGNGTFLGWSDPGEGKFFAATSFTWTFRDIGGAPSQFGDTRTQSEAEISFVMAEERTYELTVFGQNIHEQETLTGPTATLRVTIPKAPKGGWAEGGCDPDVQDCEVVVGSVEGSDSARAAAAHPAIDDALKARLHEIRTRARDSARRAVQAAGVWPDDARYRRFVDERRAIGERLRREVLPDVVGAEDAKGLLPGPIRVFGSGTQLFRYQLPYMLACAHELGSGFAALLGASAEKTEDTGRIAAVFHFGSGLFDRIHEHHPAAFEQVSAAFNQAILTALMAGDAGASRTLDQRARESKAIEIRMLLRSIAWSAETVRRLIRAGGPTAATLTNTVFAAFAAELATKPAERRGESALVDAARARIATPLSLVRDVIVANVGTRDAATIAAFDEVVSATAATIWLLDDLTDVTPDLWGSGLNALVVRAGGHAARTLDPSEVRRIADRLVAGDIIERAAEDLRASFVRLKTALGSPKLARDASARVLEARGCLTRLALG